ncbi:hypothetical protein KC352_g14 [Hortaea werneckii]|nr:hypothetical protein KC352_g14 [Hortaea werneckii]
MASFNIIAAFICCQFKATIWMPCRQKGAGSRLDERTRVPFGPMAFFLHCHQLLFRQGEDVGWDLCLRLVDLPSAAHIFPFFEVSACPLSSSVDALVSDFARDLFVAGVFCDAAFSGGEYFTFTKIRFRSVSSTGKGVVSEYSSGTGTRYCCHLQSGAGISLVAVRVRGADNFGWGWNIRVIDISFFAVFAFIHILVSISTGAAPELVASRGAEASWSAIVVKNDSKLPISGLESFCCSKASLMCSVTDGESVNVAAAGIACRFRMFITSLFSSSQSGRLVAQHFLKLQCGTSLALAERRVNLGRPRPQPAEASSRTLHLRAQSGI